MCNWNICFIQCAVLYIVMSMEVHYIYMVIIKAVTQLFFHRIPCNIYFQEESSRTGLQTAQCKSNLQSPFISLLDCCKP